ncbi:hypothetical protein MLD38_018609 [Melastoma candidum]|uniref:Uncharacterized protein n=1 Tax=Melastoma candidum TaxID=119954 RepID=A0ACB9QUD9_9MYRT|nr:hypothetical protein MLD38_018609 [Melastoma candidum]
MMALGDTADGHTSGVLAKWLWRSGNSDMAMEFVADAVERGCSFNNIVEYNTFVDGLCKEGRLEEALELLGAMRSKGFLPNNVTYSTLIHGLCGQGKCDEARALLEEQVTNCIIPNVVSYTSLIQGLSVCS